MCHLPLAGHAIRGGQATGARGRGCGPQGRRQAGASRRRRPGADQALAAAAAATPLRSRQRGAGARSPGKPGASRSRSLPWRRDPHASASPATGAARCRAGWGSERGRMAGCTGGEARGQAGHAAPRAAHPRREPGRAQGVSAAALAHAVPRPRRPRRLRRPPRAQRPLFASVARRARPRRRVYHAAPAARAHVNRHFAGRLADPLERVL